MKRNFVFSAWILLCACFLCCFTLSVRAFELTDLGSTKWKPYAGIPEHQEIEADSLTALGLFGGNLCPKYSSLQCMEILYNAWYGLGSGGTNKLDLDIRYFPTGYINTVLGNLVFNSGSLCAHSKQNINSFPNYDKAYYRIYSYKTLWNLNGNPPSGTPNLTSLRNAVNQTPVIIRIKYYAGIFGNTVQNINYN